MTYKNQDRGHGKNKAKGAGTCRKLWGSGGAVTRSDIHLIEKAIRQRWPVLEEKRPALVERLMQVFGDSTDSRLVIAAARALVAMDAQNG